VSIAQRISRSGRDRHGGNEGTVYIFLDEGGNFDFSSRGTRYFTLTSVTLQRPFEIAAPLSELKYDLIEGGMEIEYFHAAEDKQAVRNRVFEIIRRHLPSMWIDSVIVEKTKVSPRLRRLTSFYPQMLGRLLRQVLGESDLSTVPQVIVVTDRIPVAKKRSAVEKAAKTVLASSLPEGLTYRVLHHQSKSSFELQVADYCNWAIYRKWAGRDERSYAIVSDAVRNEVDVFAGDERCYY